jgi:hypothetical protein
MNKVLGAEGDMTDGLRSFLEAESIPLQVDNGPAAAVQVRRTSSREESRLEILYSGGWISCSLARAMAGRLGIGSRQLGKLLDHLDIKVRECDLGCF